MEMFCKRFEKKRPNNLILLSLLANFRSQVKKNFSNNLIRLIGPFNEIWFEIPTSKIPLNKNKPLMVCWNEITLRGFFFTF